MALPPFPVKGAHSLPFEVQEWFRQLQLLVGGTAGLVPVASGGTGITSYAIGDLIYASATTTLSKLADVATGNALISGGVGVAPAWGKIGISTHVSGLGTGVATFLGTPSSANLLAAITDETGTGALVFANNSALTGTTSIETANVSDSIIAPKTSGKGIKVDNTTPTFGWRDMLGKVIVKAIGANDPVWSVYRGTIYAYKCSNAIMNETWQDFHIPHDYVPGTDMYIHVHWTQNVVDTGGAAGAPGAIKWYFDLSYADGHGTAGGAADPFIAAITQSVTQQGSTTQYGHMLAEVQFTNAGGDATHIDRAAISVDGIILCRTYRDPADVADTLDQQPFVLFVDIHYQSTNVATKQKSPDFYT